MKLLVKRLFNLSINCEAAGQLVPGKGSLNCDHATKYMECGSCLNVRKDAVLGGSENGQCFLNNKEGPSCQ